VLTRRIIRGISDTLTATTTWRAVGKEPSALLFRFRVTPRVTFSAVGPDVEDCFISILSRRRQPIAGSTETTKCVAVRDLPW
jgi:hypothetical protein